MARGNASAAVAALASRCLCVLDNLDAALAADVNFLLGTWIADAVSWGAGDANATALWAANARAQVTIWGPVSSGVNDDYGARRESSMRLSYNLQPSTPASF